MKKYWIFWTALVALCLGCDANLGGNPKLPEKRPPNFRISCSDGGGMLPESEYYFVGKDSAGRESFFEQSNNRWSFVPAAKMLDEFYARLREKNPTNMKTRNGGEVHDRGGVSMQIDFEKEHIQISNSGSDFVVEEDEARFFEVYGDVVAFVEQGLATQKVKTKVSLSLGVTDTAIVSCSIYLSKEQVVVWTPQNASTLILDRALDLLPGQYGLRCYATVSSKYVSLNRQVAIGRETNDFQIVLKSDTFELNE